LYIHIIYIYIYTWVIYTWVSSNNQACTHFISACWFCTWSTGLSSSDLCWIRVRKKVSDPTPRKNRQI